MQFACLDFFVLFWFWFLWVYFATLLNYSLSTILQPRPQRIFRFKRKAKKRWKNYFQKNCFRDEVGNFKFCEKVLLLLFCYYCLTLAKSKKIKQNWTRLENFDICFCVSFDRYCQKLVFWRWDRTLAYVYIQFWDFLFLNFL